MSNTLTVGNVLIDAMNSSLGVADAGLNAARRGLSFCAKLNKKSGINAAATVLTDAGFIQAIPEGKQIVVACFYIHLDTASDWVEFEFVYTANADGTGDVVALSPLIRIETGTAASADAPTITQLPVPLLVKYSATSKAVTMRAQTNDASAVATFAFLGWHENLT